MTSYSAHVVGASGRLRPTVYWLVHAPGLGTKTHAVIERSERTICGREVGFEISDDEYVPGRGTAPEPSCRVCRKVIRSLAAGVNPSSVGNRRPGRMSCPRCWHRDMDLTIREVTVDRCVVLLEDDEFIYDVDGDPKRRVEERRLECRRCRAVLSEKDLVRASERWPEPQPFDLEAVQAKHSAKMKVVSEELARTVERLARPVVEDTPF